MQQRGHHLVAVALGEAAVQLLPAAGEERHARDERGEAGGAARAGGGNRETEWFHDHWFFISEPIASFVDVTTPIFACMSICIAVASAEACSDAANI
ncbi:type III secretion apparatus lipo, YscJ/HrcJ family domain protein [Burkholderia pseudomallei]|nr:type III secretion apparatus lipo, YscJ/HrcJ family domain protein [Burkholderia pseudomallei]